MNLISLRQITESELPTLLQVLSGRASGGFPSPAADHYEAPISLDDLVDLRAPHVWLGETEGDSMSPAGIMNGTKLVIDRARTPQIGNVVVAYIQNQPVVKRLDRQLNGGWMLSSDNPEYPPIQGLEEIEVFGVVTWSLTVHVPKRPTYALVDCNSFYCSCERLFRPELRQAPVVVLSNNDGCVIARTPEAKALGIKMGDPFFKIRDVLKAKGVAAFSSNYELYGDISSRVQRTIESLAPRVEVYSIDESFADLTGIAEPLGDFGRQIQTRVRSWTGMPVGIGIGHTKTLAKAAQHASKLYKERTGGVVDLRADHAVEWLLKRMPTQEVWGVGRRISMKLEADGVTTAWQLANADPKTIRQRYGVVLERTVRELKGEPCIELQEAEPDRQAICTSRMFGERITTLEAMREALATYMHRATQKLRKQQSLTAVFRVAVLTSPFGDGPKYANSVMCYPPYPTDDVLLLTRAAMEGLEVIWRDGYRYSKAEILLMDLRKRGEFTGDLFTPSQPAKSDELMRVLDRINVKFGKNALHCGRMPVEATWAMKREMMSQSYTTSIEHLMRFRAI